MFERNVSFFAALLFAAPAVAKGSDHQHDTGDVLARLDRAKAVMDLLTEPVDTGGIVRDASDPFKIAWNNFRNNWNNWNNFRNNWNNFRNNWNNFRNAPVYRPTPQVQVPATRPAWTNAAAVRPSPQHHRLVDDLDRQAITRLDSQAAARLAWYGDLVLAADLCA